MKAGRCCGARLWRIELADDYSGPRGEHGYDPHDAMSMRGIFVAAGPAFKRGVSVPPFENVSVYNVLTSVLGVGSRAERRRPFGSEISFERLSHLKFERLACLDEAVRRRAKQ